jgi:hypothetical protein
MQPGCASSFKDGRLSEASLSLEKVTKECEDAFINSKVTSQLTVEDDNTFKLGATLEHLHQL